MQGHQESTFFLRSVIFPYNSLYTQAVAYTLYFGLGELVHRSIMKVLYCAIGICKETNEQRMKTLSSEHARNRHKDLSDGKRTHTHRRPFCTPKPDVDLCMRVDLPLAKITVENQDWGCRPAFSKTLPDTTNSVSDRSIR